MAEVAGIVYVDQGLSVSEITFRPVRDMYLAPPDKCEELVKTAWTYYATHARHVDYISAWRLMRAKYGTYYFIQYVRGMSYNPHHIPRLIRLGRKVCPAVVWFIESQARLGWLDTDSCRELHWNGRLF